MQAYGQGIGTLAPIQGQMATQQTQDPTALQTALGWTGMIGGIMNPRLGQMPGSYTTQMTPDPTALQTALGTMSVVGGIMGGGGGMPSWL